VRVYAAGFQHLSTPSHRHQANSFVTRPLLNREDLEALLFTTSCLLPIQFYDRIRSRCILQGEEALMFAVLEDGIQRYLKCTHIRNFHERQELNELELWLGAPENSSVFSFKSLCDSFGIDARILRKSLRWLRARLQEDGRRRPPLPRLRKPPVRRARQSRQPGKASVVN
jgi:hypothetical protein